MSTTRTIEIGTELYNAFDGILTVLEIDGAWLSARIEKSGKVVRVPTSTVVKATPAASLRTGTYVAADYVEAYAQHLETERGAGCARAWRETGMASLRRQSGMPATVQTVAQRRAA